MLILLNIGLQAGLLVVGLGLMVFEVPGGGELAGAGALGLGLGLALGARWWRQSVRLAALGRVGHELRTPLAVMTAWADQATLPGGADPEVLDRQIRRMRVIVEGTLQGARRLGPSRVRRSAPCLTRGGLGQPVAAVVEDLSRLWPGADQELSHLPASGIGTPRLVWHLGPVDTLCQVPGDDRFHHILANLVQNAFRHGVPRARPLVRPWEVHVTLTPHPDSLETVVVDEGPGVWVHPLTGLPRSLDAHRGEPGVGLGFYLVQELVASAGGALKIGPRKGRGTEVRFSLPLEARG